MANTPEPLAKLIRDYWNINVAAYAADLGGAISRGQVDAATARTFRAQLAGAIRKPLISASEYNALTGDNEFASPEEVQSELREFWHAVFPGEDPDTAEN